MDRATHIKWSKEGRGVLRVALLLLATAFLVWASGPGDLAPRSTILIVSNHPATAGGIHCVTVIPAGGEKKLAVCVELNGVELPGVSVERQANGSLLVCYPVPAAADAGTITIIVSSAGGRFASASFPVC